MASQQKETGDLSIPGLVRQLADETTTLVRQELELARAEAARAGEAVVTLAKQELQLATAEMTVHDPNAKECTFCSPVTTASSRSRSSGFSRRQTMTSLRWSATPYEPNWHTVFQDRLHHR